MLLLHEQMDPEAKAIAAAVQKVYGLPVHLREAEIVSLLPPLPALGGYLAEPTALLKLPGVSGPGCMGLTRGDLFAGNQSPDDDWVFGMEHCECILLSGARLLARNETQGDLSLRRLVAMAIHEIGHAVVRGSHRKPAVWVNAATGYELPLGKHCPDRRCAMYEVVDLIAPLPEQGYMRLGDEPRYDAGLDELIARAHEDWLCSTCLASVSAASHWLE